MVAPLTVRPVNEHDTELFPHSFDALADIADLLDLDIQGSYITLNYEIPPISRMAYTYSIRHDC